MTVLPVRLEQWQLQCCGVDYQARIGRRWAAPLIFYPDEWAGAEVVTPGWSILPDHRISARRLRLIELLRTDRAKSDVLLDLDVSRGTT
jgi:hypothetical protein